MQRSLNGAGGDVEGTGPRGWKRSRGGGGAPQANEASVVEGVCEALLALSQVSPMPFDDKGVMASTDVPVKELSEGHQACGDILVQSTPHISKAATGVGEAAVAELQPAHCVAATQRGSSHCRPELECNRVDVERVPAEGMIIEQVERPLTPVNNHAAAFEACCAAITGLNDSDRLNKEHVAIMRDGIDFFFAMSREDFAGRDLLRVLREASVGARVNAMHMPRMSRSQVWIERTPGFMWATEVLSTPNAYTLFFCFVDSKFQVTCNDLTSRLFMCADEIYRSAKDLRSTHVHMLANLIVPRFVENFYRAVYESCFCKGTRERQTIVQLRDRSGNLVRCLATVRTHWHEGTAALAVRFWPFSSLLEWSSFTEQACC